MKCKSIRCIVSIKWVLKCKFYCPNTGAIISLVFYCWYFLNRWWTTKKQTTSIKNCCLSNNFLLVFIHRLDEHFGKFKVNIFASKFLVNRLKNRHLEDKKSKLKLNLNNWQTLFSTSVCWFLSRWTLNKRDPSNLIRIRFPVISAG